MNKIIYIVLLLFILMINAIILKNYGNNLILLKSQTIIENFSELTDEEILNTDLNELLVILSKMQRNYNTLNKEQKIVYDKILKRLTNEQNKLKDDMKFLLKEIQTSNPLNSFNKPAYYKSCKDESIDIDTKIKLSRLTQKDVSMTCASICKKNPKCLSFDYDNNTKVCRFSSNCHKDSNYLSKPMTNIIYTKKGGKIPPASNYDIHLNKKMINIQKNNYDYNVPCRKNQIGKVITSCNREKASKECDNTPNCISWELHKSTKTCKLYSDCHTPMLSSDNNVLYNPNNTKRSPDANAWGTSPEVRKASNRGQLNSPQAWSARHKNTNQYYDITLDGKQSVAGIVTQGRQDTRQYVTKLKVSYFNNDKIERNSGIITLHKSRQTKNLRNELEFSVFNSPVDATKIRIRPLAWKNHPSLRIGILINKNNIKNYISGTLKKPNLLKVRGPPSIKHIPLRYDELINIYNENATDVLFNRAQKKKGKTAEIDFKTTRKRYLLDDHKGNRDARFGDNNLKSGDKEYSHHRIQTHLNKSRGIMRYGTDIVYITSGAGGRRLQSIAINGRFANHNYGHWERWRLYPPPGRKWGDPIYSGDIVYIRSYKWGLPGIENPHWWRPFLGCNYNDKLYRHTMLNNWKPLRWICGKGKNWLGCVDDDKRLKSNMYKATWERMIIKLHSSPAKAFTLDVI